MAQTGAPRRRFAPVPIETTFERRKGGPTAELTPSPSPRSPSPPFREWNKPKEKRRFAPQLIESSRRSRRAGDKGPATRPADKTDITPNTNHIYAHKARRRHSKVQSQARRESCDDETAGRVFDLAAREVERERRLEEVAMSAFPNSGIRIGGAEHFFVREGSEDDNSEGRSRQATRHRGYSRRNSSEEDVSWAVREMQEHHVQLNKTQEDRISSLDLDQMSIDSPPADALWTTKRQTSTSSLQPIGETLMPFIPNEPLPTIRETNSQFRVPDSPPVRPIGEVLMPYIPSAPPGKAADMPFMAPTSAQIPPETGFRNRGPFGVPAYSGYRNRDMAADRDLHKLRSRASPPMLGKELTFRMCPSPKHTKLEPDHLWTKDGTENSHRDMTGQFGLWQGYCYDPHMKDAWAMIDRPAMIATPHPPSSPGDPFSTAFEAAPYAMSTEPSRVPSIDRSLPASTSEHRPKNGTAKGLHMLMGLDGLDEKLRKEKAVADREELIAAEFNDTFVTQVYNYLSMGYPAMARNYDEELSKISRIPADDLESDDETIMDGIAKAKGHIALDVKDEDEDDMCPRWHALKLYILEWARQHPDLDSISPLSWGVRERRGSWGI